MRNLKIYLATLILALSVGMCNAETLTKVKSPIDTTCQSKTKNHQLNGDATYYGDKYQKSRKTASGKRFDKNKLTAAHKTLPFGTIVLVTNIKNGKTIKVEITDRGPFGKGRVIDLSPRAFKEIANLKAGVVPVKLTIVSYPKS